MDQPSTNRRPRPVTSDAADDGWTDEGQAQVAECVYKSLRLVVPHAAGQHRPSEAAAGWRHFAFHHDLDDDGDHLASRDVVEWPASEVTELNRLAGTLRRWRTEIINLNCTGD